MQNARETGDYKPKETEWKCRIRDTGITRKGKVADSLRDHKKVARESLQYYKSMKEKCAKQWQAIVEVEEKSPRTDAEEERLKELKHCYTLLLSADYQMQKLIPHWGQSPQPGSTYYLQKLSIDLFGIVDHRDESAAVYIFDERVGHKTADHTISYLLHYLKSQEQFPVGYLMYTSSLTMLDPRIKTNLSCPLVWN